jgi:hypothetical protein
MAAEVETRRQPPRVNHPQRLVGRYAAVGALLSFGVVVARSIGDYEGGDVIVVLGPLAAMLGAGLGAVVGIAVRRRYDSR